MKSSRFTTIDLLFGFAAVLLFTDPIDVVAQTVPFEFLTNVEVEISIRCRDSGVSLEQPVQHETSMEVKAKQFGNLWGVKVVEQVWRNLDNWRVDITAVRGQESIISGYLMPGKKRPSDREIINDLSVSLTSEKAGGKESGRMFDSTFPTNVEVLIPFGILHRKLIRDSFLKNVERKKLGDGSVQVSAKVPEGHFEMILEPGPDGIPKRISLVQAGNDLNLGRPLNSIQMNGGYIYPAGGIRNARFLVDEIETDVFESTRYISKWRVREELDCAGGVLVRKEKQCAITSIRSINEKDSENLIFDLPIPVGHPVWVMDSGLHYRWNGRWAVPDTLAMREYSPDRNFSKQKLYFLFGSSIALIVGAIVCRRVMSAK